MPSMPSSISPVFQPAIAIYSIAEAASEAENLVLAPISRALARSWSKSSPVAPEMAETLLISWSKSAAVLTAAVPKPVTAAVTGKNFLPTPSTAEPTVCIFSPTASILARVVLVTAACSCRDLRFCSVSTISRWSASYCSCVILPSASCWFACSAAVFKVVSFSLVASMASFSIFCFWVTASVLEGSSFRSLLTSLSPACVVLMDLLTPSSALDNFVVSPPISTVMPAILDAMRITTSFGA